MVRIVVLIIGKKDLVEKSGFELTNLQIRNSIAYNPS